MTHNPLPPELAELARIARRLAHRELVPRFAHVARQTKRDGSVLTEADLAMQRGMLEALAAHAPGEAVLAEEMTAEQQAQLLAGSDRLWCLDPLDGTSNFATGLPYFAVSLALLVQGETELALVYDPLRDECFCARRGAGAWLNDTPLQVAPTPPLRHAMAAVDLKRLRAPLAAAVAARPPFASQRNYGASTLDWCWIAADRFHIYLHGGQKLWDYAAGHLILLEAGGHALTIGGERVPARTLATRSVVAAADSAVFPGWLDWVQGASRD